LTVFGVKIVELNETLLLTSREAKIILEPVNASDALDTTSEMHVWRSILLVEVENLDLVLVYNTGEHVTAVGELDFVTALKIVLFDATESRCKHVQNLDLVGHRNDDVQARGMESDGLALFGELVLDFEGSGRVVPNGHGLVLGARNDQLFADAHVQTRDLVLVEHALHVVESLLVSVFDGVQVNIAGDDLPLVRDHVDLFLLRVDRHALNHIGLVHVGRLLSDSHFLVVDADDRQTFIDICSSVNDEFEPCRQQEAVIETDDSFDWATATRNGRIIDERFELTAVFTDDHLAGIRADEHVASSLGPSVTREVIRDLLALIHIIDLRVFNGDLVVDVLAQILKRVVGASQEHSSTLHIERIVGELEDTGLLDRGRDGQAERHGLVDALFLNVPEDDGPVRVTTQSHDLVWLALVEGRAHHLIRLELLALVRCRRQLLLLRCA
jgi:hypothetical protein